MNKLIAMFLLLFSFDLFAQQAAVVLFASGNVTANHGGASRTLTRGASVDAGDSITTPANGSASIKYTNGTLVNLSGGTNYKILSYTPKQAAVQIKAELNHGTINSKTTGTTKEIIKTPVMALAVLGTKYELSVACIRQTNKYNKGKCTNTVALRVFQGVVEAGGKMVTAGSSVIITSGGVRPASLTSSIQINNAAAGTVSTVNVQNTNSSSSSGAAVTTTPPPTPPPPTPPLPPIGP